MNAPAAEWQRRPCPICAASKVPAQRALAPARGFRARVQTGTPAFRRPHDRVLLAAAGERDGGVRVGFTVGKVLGGAVVRNRMKRRLREAVRLHGMIPAAMDVVINPKKSLLTAEFVGFAARDSAGVRRDREVSGKAMNQWARELRTLSCCADTSGRFRRSCPRPAATCPPAPNTPWKQWIVTACCAAA